MRTMTTSTSNMNQLSAAEFKKVKEIIYNYCGIDLQQGKEALVQSRLMKRVRRLGLQNISEYFKYLGNDASGVEFLNMVDVITTNKTSFFRENKHFDFMRAVVLPKAAGRDVKWWSAGCSTGEEPITCGITLHEARKEHAWSSVKILATDISREVLTIAKNGIYPTQRMEDVPAPILKKYFEPTYEGHYQIIDSIRDMITYGRLNLMENWPMQGDFQIIMCRNVMIYFDRKTQQELVNKFHALIEPGGYLFLGHSESISADNKNFKNVAPAVYQKLE